MADFDEQNEDIGVIAQGLIDQCITYLDQSAGARAEVEDYYKGRMSDVDSDAASEKVDREFVVPVLRNTVRKLLPSVHRAIFSSDEVAQFIPSNADYEEQARVASAYVNRVIMSKAESRNAVKDAVKDAMLMGTGILKAEAVEVSGTQVEDYSNKDEDDIAAIADDGGEVTDLEQGEDGLYSFSVHRPFRRTEIRLTCVPRSDFLIDPVAMSVDEAAIVGERRYASRSELVALGYDRKVVEELPSDEGRSDDQVYQARRGDHLDETLSRELPASQELVLVYDVCIRIDRDGDGVSELHRVVVGSTSVEGAGEGYAVLFEEQINEAPYAPVLIEREAHLFEGHSISEETMDFQRIASEVARQAKDNLFASNYPKAIVATDAVMNDDAFADWSSDVPIEIDRSRGSMEEVIKFVEVPYTAEKSWALLGQIKEMVGDATGVTEQSGGLDLDSGTGTGALTATQATIASDASTAQSEMMIQELRNCLKVAFRKVYKLVVAHVERDEVYRMDGSDGSYSFQSFDFRGFPMDMDCVVRAGLTTGLRSAEISRLDLIYQNQLEMMEKFPDNPIVTPKNLMYTLKRKMEAAGEPNVQMYMNEASDEEIAAWQERQSKLAEAEAARQNEHEVALEQVKTDAAAAMKATEVEAERDKQAAQRDADIIVNQVKEESKIAIKNAELNNALAVKQLEVDHDWRKHVSSLTMEQRKINADLILGGETVESQPELPLDDAPASTGAGDDAPDGDGGDGGDDTKGSDDGGNDQ